VAFKPKLIKRDKEGHIILTKGAIHEEEITIVNLCIFNVGALNYIKHTLKDLKLPIDSNTVVMEGFNTSLSPVGNLDKDINKEILELNNTIDLTELIDV
jgi:hypothetical protein